MKRGTEMRLRKLEAMTSPEPLLIVGYDLAECHARLKAIEATGGLVGREPRFIITGVPRSQAYAR
jgi:hypothetical protein